MEEDLRKIHLENLLNTLEDSDKDKKNRSLQHNERNG